jgi:O-antigen biosynthesis protein
MKNELPSRNEFPTPVGDQVYAKGKFLYRGDKKFLIKGVTYGTFKPLADGCQFPDSIQVEKDFQMMAAQGINCVRTYTSPPRYLLDLALAYNLKVMIGLPWEQHINFLDDAQRKKDIIARVQSGAWACGQHPAILCFAVGNEIPASLVRWYGKRRIEQFIKQLYKAVKTVHPSALVTYVNYPTTEYLDLKFLDFDCFNVYLETPAKLSAYLSRLHNLAGYRPLVLAEIGLDSLRKGQDTQAETLSWQIETVFAKGCAGMFVFAWTDEWWRGGFEIQDWDFGLVDRQRQPKPALHAVSHSLQQVPFREESTLPFISVVVCTYNGAATIDDCLQGLVQLDYPAYEIIVVDDGSQDNTADLVRKYPVTLISTPNQGLSSARNTGLRHAQGEIVAYIDDDAYPDEHWLRYLGYEYTRSAHAGIGGPNIAPPEDGPIARCVANAPGGPVHVLVTDEIAEHIPGCNMSFRKAALLEIGGFDPVFHTAGDDVDICWRIQKAGYTIGFHPAAVVWHHRRNSLKTYWKQQKGYGKAEALLETKWPEKYNAFGHLAWCGRIYGNGCTLSLKLKKERIFHGTWGSALFQSVYQPAEGYLMALPLMPEWYLFAGLLATFASLGFLWQPLLMLWPLFTASLVVVVVQAAMSALKNASLGTDEKRNPKYTLLITLLHVIQPVARLYGRLKHGLSPWRSRGSFIKGPFTFVLRHKIFTFWSEEWRAPEDWLQALEQHLMKLKCRVKRGGDFDQWDIEVRNGFFSCSYGLLTIEEHSGGKQLLRFRASSAPAIAEITAFLLLGVAATLAALDQAPVVAAFLGLCCLLILGAYCKSTAININALHEAFSRLERSPASLEKSPAAMPPAKAMLVLTKELEPAEICFRKQAMPNSKIFRRKV